MVNYNTKDWIHFIFSLHKADTLSKLTPMILFLATYSFAVAYILQHLHFTENNHFKNISVVHNTLGLVISLLLVFRTNTAYERWWEGRKLWGSLVNNSRNLAARFHTWKSNDKKEAYLFWTTMLGNFPFVLKEHLRTSFVPEDQEYAEGWDPDQLDPNIHLPTQAVALLQTRLHEWKQKGWLDGSEMIIVNEEVRQLLEICGGCERIKKTPIPFSYSSFLKRFIFFYVITLPFGMVFSLGYLVIPAVIFIFYVLASLELIAEEIEDPFGRDANDLPTDEIAATIRRNMKELAE